MYEYKCEDCESTFTVVATMTEKVKGLPMVCLICGSERVRQLFSGIALIGGKSGGSHS